MLFNASGSFSLPVLSCPRRIGEQFYGKPSWERRSVPLSGRVVSPSSRGDTAGEERERRNTGTGRRVGKETRTTEGPSVEWSVIEEFASDLEKSLVSDSLASLSRWHIRGRVQFLRDTYEGCLLTLNSPPQPSSSSKRYPSIAGPLCPVQPIIPWPGGGCQATVTLLFSALHSSGISKGAPGAGNTYVETV